MFGCSLSGSCYDTRNGQENYSLTHTHTHRCAPVSVDSVFAVYSGPPKNLRMKEINGSYVSKFMPSKNGP
jgi:hypothetical protein